MIRSNVDELLPVACLLVCKASELLQALVNNLLVPVLLLEIVFFSSFFFL